MGTQHKFTHEEYLEQLANSKFGLSLHGYGAKCHREIELMACGTVPIISVDVCTDSYINPLVEGVHYISVKEPHEVQEKINAITEEKWNEMSAACKKWYVENCTPINLWNTLISHIIYTS
jgi:glycosyltransferase involved in cell wall biosynthesis